MVGAFVSCNGMLDDDSYENHPRFAYASSRCRAQPLKFSASEDSLSIRSQLGCEENQLLRSADGARLAHRDDPSSVELADGGATTTRFVRQHALDPRRQPCTARMCNALSRPTTRIVAKRAPNDASHDADSSAANPSRETLWSFRSRQRMPTTMISCGPALQQPSGGATPSLCDPHARYS